MSTDSEEVFVTVIFGTLVLFISVIFIISFLLIYQRRSLRHQLELNELESQKQMELLQASIQSEEEERQRIAAELHDDVGATLSSARLFLHQAEKHSTSPELIRQSGQLVDDSIRKVRDISHKLQPGTLQALGLHTALQALSDVYKRSGSLKFDVLPASNLPRLDAHTELHLYRIVQELTNNIVRHSRATFIVLQVSSMNDSLSVIMQHDGNGMDAKSYEGFLQQKNGIGLKNISNRLRFINGKISFTKQGSTAFVTEVQVPC